LRICFLIFSVFLFDSQLFGQGVSPSESLLITGKVKKERVFSLSEMKKIRTINLGEVNTSCSPKQRKNAKGVKAILVRDLLDSVNFDYSSSRTLNQFYFKFEATDGYAIVYSFNEVYNTETGKNLYIVVEKDGIDITQMENRILVLTTSDIKSGSRNIKNLARIVVCKAE
jgi:hypothetical protein